MAAKGGDSSDIKAKFYQFDEHTHEADFLFTSELCNHLDEVWTQANSLIAKLEENTYLASSEELKPEDRHKVVEIREWFLEKRITVKSCFSKEIARPLPSEGLTKLIK